MSERAVPPGYKDTEVGVIPEEWEVSTVGEEFDIRLGKMLDTEKNSGVPKPYLGNKAVQWNRINVEDLPTMKMSQEDTKRFRLLHGDLLVCEGGEIGRAAIWNSPVEECYYQKALHRLRSLHGYNPRLMLDFLLYWTSQDTLSDFVSQTSIAHLTREKFAVVPLPIPPLPEQRAIAAALSDVDDLISSLNALIEKKRAIKTAAMQRLLTGKRRLPGFDGEWETRRLGDVFTFLRTASNSRSDLSEDGEVGYIHYGDIHGTTSSFLDCDTATFPQIASELINRTPFIEDGDVVMVDASEDYDGVGKSIEVKNTRGRKLIAGLHTLLLRGDKSIVADGFKGYLQYIPELRSALIRLATGISVYGISKNNVKNVEVNLPPLEEQTAIATVLSDMDTEIEALEARREKTKLVKRGMMQELLTGRTRLV